MLPMKKNYREARHAFVRELGVRNLRTGEAVFHHHFTRGQGRTAWDKLCYCLDWRVEDEYEVLSTEEEWFGR